MKSPAPQSATILSMDNRVQTPLRKWGIIFCWIVFYFTVTFLFPQAFGRFLGIVIVIPVAVVGWYFGLSAGLLAGLFSIPINLIVVTFLTGQPWLEQLSDGGFVGYLFLMFTGFIAGNLKESTHRQKQIEQQLRSRERFLSLLNDITHTIAASQNFETLMQNLVKELASLLEADDCYITRWDATKGQVIPVAGTSTLRIPYNQLSIPRPNLTLSALEANHLIVVEDTEASPFISPELAKELPSKSAISVPLTIGEAKIGALVVSHRSTHMFSEEEKRSATQIAEQIALALWNAQQDFELTKRLRETDALTRISRALSETERIGLSNVLELIVSSAKELIPGAEQAVIHSLDVENELLIPEAAVGFQDVWAGKARMRLGKGIASQSIASGETINIIDVQTDSRFFDLGAPVHFRSLMVTPIISSDKTLGTISVQSKTPNAFSQDESNLLRALGVNAAIAIENARLLESTQQALRETSALYHINQGLVALHADELLKEAVELLWNNFNYYHVQVFVINPQTGNYTLKAASGEIGKKLIQDNHEMQAGTGIIGYAAETGSPFFTNNVDDVVFFLYDPYLPDTKAEMAIPIRNGDNLYGILDIQQTAEKPFTKRDEQLVITVADQIAVALQKAELYNNLQTALQQEKSIRNQLIQNERLAVMGRLLASVSHELNNPLQAIQNALFLLKEEKGMSEQGRNDLEIVIAESERMAGMIERLRDTYRPPQAEDLQPTHINNIVEDVYALIATHLRKNRVAFEFHPDQNLPVIHALPDQIRQILLNLMVNAVEAMSDGGTLTVDTEHLADTNEILISIADTGTGISPAILPFIFDPFVTAKKRGTGLGLTITHDIVVKHRGRIIAENQPQSIGAVFKVWLPIDPLTVEGE